MRVLVAPDSFSGTLTAREAAEAVAAGWSRRAPGDVLDLVPMSDGGPGFVDALHAALGGDLLATTVSGPAGSAVPATVLRVGDVVYVEAAQAAGSHLLDDGGAGPLAASSAGVGELVLAALGSGARRVVLGAGGVGALDGGAGLLAALGATGDRPLDRGAAGLDGLERLDVAPARERVAGVELVLASDVDAPLTGLFGTAKTAGPDLGLDDEGVARLDHLLTGLAVAVGRRTSLEPGAGAGGGAGHALLLLGGRRTPGVGLVADAVGLAERARTADLVLTGEGAFDFSSRSGKVPYGVAEVAAEALRPCVALAGQVLVGAREMRALGIEAAYAVVDLVGEERSLADPAGSLADLAERVARTWSRP